MRPVGKDTAYALLPQLSHHAQSNKGCPYSSGLQNAVLAEQATLAKLYPQSTRVARVDCTYKHTLTVVKCLNCIRLARVESREYLLVVVENFRVPLIGNFWISRLWPACLETAMRRFIRALLTASRGQRGGAENAEYEVSSRVCDKDIQIPSKHNKIYYTLPLLDYMFRLLRVIIRPSSELIQNCLIPSALWDPVALTIVGAIVLWVHTGCHRRNGPNFGRVFLMLNYTDITQNTYIQS